MKIEIDQSGKIENTNRPTVVAFSNKMGGALVILAKDKKAIQRYFRSLKKPKLFVPLTFAILVFCLIKKYISKNDQIIIDREYPGYEKLIADKLIGLFEKETKITGLAISVSQIGKKSKAHDLAWKELHKRSHKDAAKVSSEKIIKILRTNLKSGSI